MVLIYGILKEVSQLLDSMSYNNLFLQIYATLSEELDITLISFKFLLTIEIPS
jgi:hypothetical protein